MNAARDVVVDEAAVAGRATADAELDEAAERDGSARRGLGAARAQRGERVGKGAVRIEAGGSGEERVWVRAEAAATGSKTLAMEMFE